MADFFLPVDDLWCGCFWPGRRWLRLRKSLFESEPISFLFGCFDIVVVVPVVVVVVAVLPVVADAVAVLDLVAVLQKLQKGNTLLFCLSRYQFVSKVFNLIEHGRQRWERGWRSPLGHLLEFFSVRFQARVKGERR